MRRMRVAIAFNTAFICCRNDWWYCHWLILLISSIQQLCLIVPK